MTEPRSLRTRLRVWGTLLAAAVAVPLALAGCTPGEGDAAGPTSTVPAPDLPADAPVVAFYGDSYTLGTGATDAANRWSTVICRENGWREVNPSVNGLGFVNNRTPDVNLVQQVIDADPDIVFVTMGLNDNFSYDSRADDIHAAIDRDIDALHGALPDARLIVVEPFWYTDDRPASLGVISGWVEDAAKRADADYIPGASRWIEGHPEWMAGDGLHPNDQGYAEMADRMREELSKLGIS